jgi:hypothetical protein
LFERFGEKLRITLEQAVGFWKFRIETPNFREVGAGNGTTAFAACSFDFLVQTFGL